MQKKKKSTNLSPFSVSYVSLSKHFFSCVFASKACLFPDLTDLLPALYQACNLLWIQMCAKLLNVNVINHHLCVQVMMALVKKQ